jgi:hypothetical protein
MTLFEYESQTPRMTAIKRALYAPKGKKREREAEARRATTEALRREIAARKARRA